MLGGYLGQHEQQTRRNQHIAAVVHKARAVIETRRVHGQQPRPRQHGDKEKQQEIKAAKQRNNALQQRGLIEFDGGHGPQLSWEPTAVQLAGLSFADDSSRPRLIPPAIGLLP
ncbi:hypothetical protein SDC9_163183 [bioreactor metagenome]|uniref:Uncharacterized protein n=1 Tax=bioreactor metagenome TaxID=1076179 RepID=A0A645FN50_9ZZZZ